MGVFSHVKRRGLRVFRRPEQTDPIIDKPRILFVSHEATRTGAPLIILNILRHFAETSNAHLETILHNGGLLAHEFQKYSHVDCLELPRKESDDLTRRVRKSIMRSRGAPPVLAICNSMETRFVAAELDKLGIPVVFLIHELPSSYNVNDYKTVFDISQRIVFPVNAVKDETHELVPVPAEKCMVLPQGLLNPDFGRKHDREQSRTRIRQDLNLPADSHIVLGCGTLDLRKGIDHFAAVAQQVIATQTKTQDPIHFVWVGEGPRWTHSPYHYVQLDLKKTGAGSYVHFIGEREDVEPFFLGSDVFLLTSRVDPFPCVLHEAMAAQLPIITFDRSGGATEAVDQGAGIVVPYADHAQASQMVHLLCTQPHVSDSIRYTSLQRVANDYQFRDYADKILGIAESISGASLRPLKAYLPHAA